MSLHVTNAAPELASREHGGDQTHDWKSSRAARTTASRSLSSGASRPTGSRSRSPTRGSSSTSSCTSPPPTRWRPSITRSRSRPTRASPSPPPPASPSIYSRRAEKEHEMTPLKHSKSFAARVGRWSANHWKTAVAGWLAVRRPVRVRRDADRHRSRSPRRTRTSASPTPPTDPRRGRLHRRQEGRDHRGADRDGAHPVEDADRERSGLQGRDRGLDQDRQRVPAR